MIRRAFPLCWFSSLLLLAACLVLTVPALADETEDALVRPFAGYWVREGRTPDLENTVIVRQEFGRWMAFEEEKTYVSLPRETGGLTIITGKDEPCLVLLDPATGRLHVYELDGLVFRVSEPQPDPYVGTWHAVGREDAQVEIRRAGAEYIAEVLKNGRVEREETARLIPKLGGLGVITEHGREEAFLLWNPETRLLEVYEDEEVLRRLAPDEIQGIEKLRAVPDEVRSILAVLREAQREFQERTGQYAANLEALNRPVPQSPELLACRWQFGTDGKAVTAQALAPLSPNCPVRRVVLELSSGKLVVE